MVFMNLALIYVYEVLKAVTKKKKNGGGCKDEVDISRFHSAT